MAKTPGFEVGHIVFAKLKGIRHWPATITNIEVNETKSTKYSVTFFEDNTTAIVKKSNLSQYYENLHTYGKPLTDNYRNKSFNTALTKAELAFKSMTSASSEQYISIQSSIEAPPNHNYSLDNNIVNEIDNIQEKVKHFNDIENPDLETSISLAAEVGSALLAENNKLKQELQLMTLENSKLARLIQNQSSASQIIIEEHIQQLENENHLLSTRNVQLLETVQELEKQLDKEKQLHKELTSISEDHDREKEDIIHNYKTSIKKLQLEINKLRKNNESSTNKPEQISIKTDSAERKINSPMTHTDKEIASTTPPNTQIMFSEISLLKKRQDYLEQTFKTLQGPLNLSKETLSNQAQDAIQRNEKLKPNIQNRHTTIPNKNKKATKSKKSLNHFSISLQVAKNEANLRNDAKIRKIGGTRTYRKSLEKEVSKSIILDDYRPPPTLSDIMLSDDDDLETTNTRSPASRYIRNTAINSNSGRLSKLNEEDQANLDSIKIFSFPPEETPLLTTQINTDDDMPYTCELHLIDTDQTTLNSAHFGREEMLSIADRHKEKSISFNNFVTIKDRQDKIHIFICFSSEKNNWKRKLYNFLEIANECIKFPALFSIKLEDALQTTKLTQAAVREFLQVFLQFACNSYLHRFRLYINERKQKKNIDKILDLIVDKNQRSTAKMSPTRDTPIYSVWRTAQGSLPRHNTYNPPYPEFKNRIAFIQGAMYEQKELWKSKETNILYELSQIYKQYDISHIYNKDKMHDVCEKTKDKYGIINLKTGELLSKQNNERQYHFGFDGVRLVELTKNRENKYHIAQNNITTNNFLLVSDDTQILNDLRLYNSIKQIDIPKITDMNLNLVQGVPGCGKTAFILNSYKTGDLILFPTKDSAIDFRKRFSSRYKSVTKNTCNDTFRTLHSFLINSTQHLQQGKSYNRLIVDEALMMHAGEILFAAVKSGVREIMLIGDKNQIPFINRSQALEVKFHNISEITPISKVLSTTFRCTTSATAVLSKLYEQGMKTTNHTTNELKLHDFEGLTNLNQVIDRTKHICLVFKQSEKRELVKLGYNTATIHEFQGRQAENIALIRTSAIKEDIYDSKPHCIVAISRHTKSFIYITPSRSDTLSRWIQNAHTLTSEELSDFQIKNPIEPSQNYIRNKTSPLAKQSPAAAQQHNNHFLGQRRQPKERHKSKALLPRTFWNSTFKKIKLLAENTKLRLHIKM